MSSAPIPARAAPNCASPKKSDARLAPQSLQLRQRRVARALDRAHGFPWADRADLCLPDVAALSPGRAEEGAGKRAHEFAFAKRRRQRPDRGAHLALGAATAIERGLSENDPDRRAKHC